MYVKGCRVHEMIQGGINAVTYSSFVVTRAFSESETGLDARTAPLVFFRLEPGEYAYYGFEERARRRTTLPDGRELWTCCSTLQEHEIRKTTSELDVLVNDVVHLGACCNRLPERSDRANDDELRLLVRRISELTQKTYNSVAQRYRTVRDKPHSDVNALLDELLDMARTKERSGALGIAGRRIRLLDVGAGDGRDLRYLASKPDVDAVGIDNAHAFVELMGEFAARGAIAIGSFHEADMQAMDCFADSTFDVVRHNASLVHMPLLPRGIGADEVLHESNRVLRRGGLLFVLVKRGAGLHVIDTGEDLGPRVFQLYSSEDLRALLSRTGFSVLEIRDQVSHRASGPVEWLIAFAEKT